MDCLKATGITIVGNSTNFGLSASVWEDVFSETDAGFVFSDDCNSL